jgi:uncharacterized protein (DUF427 family)
MRQKGRPESRFLGRSRACYYYIVTDGRRFEGAVWSYEAPSNKHRALAGRLAFYDEEVPDNGVRPKP